MPVVKKKEGQDRPQNNKREVRYDNVLMGPGEYEVTRGSTFVIEIHLRLRDEKDKWWVVTTKELAQTTESVTFRMWSYDEMVDLRKLATKYDTVRRVHMIDHDVLNRLKIQKFLLKWTFDKKNNRLELHHANGVLVDESWDKVRLLQPNILKHIIDEMNIRYEHGG
jgi:hypothetical protein